MNKIAKVGVTTKVVISILVTIVVLFIIILAYGFYLDSSSAPKSKSTMAEVINLEGDFLKSVDKFDSYFKSFRDIKFTTLADRQDGLRQIDELNKDLDKIKTLNTQIVSLSEKGLQESKK